MSIFRRKREEELQDRIEELQIRIIELQDENTALQEQIDAKVEVIRSLWAKEKQLEKRIERMLFELRVSDEVLTIATEKRHEERQ